jgi:hypothetical protein
MNNEKIVISFIQWLWDEVRSASGDGDAIWYSKFFNVKELFPLVEKFNKEQDYPFKECKLEGDIIYWTDNQESIIITNNVELWNRKPDWQQVSIRW